MNTNNLIINAFTNDNEDPSHTVGSVHEKEYFKVIPLATVRNGYNPQKLFFHNSDEYEQWQQVYYQKR